MKQVGGLGFAIEEQYEKAIRLRNHRFIRNSAHGVRK
jgi:hypothetical protein